MKIINNTIYDLDKVVDLNSLKAYILNGNEKVSLNKHLDQTFKDYISYKTEGKNNTRVLTIEELKQKFPGLEIQGNEPATLLDGANLVLIAIEKKIEALQEKAETQDPAKITEDQEVLKEEGKKTEAEKVLEDPKLSQAKTSIEAMVEAYNAAIKEAGDNNVKETKFIEELKAKLGITDSPEGFDKAAKEGFNAMRRFYKGAVISEEGEKENPKVFSNPTFGEKVKACLLMILKIVTLGLAAIPEATTSTRANKLTAQGFQKMVEEKRAQPAVEQQI